MEHPPLQVLAPASSPQACSPMAPQAPPTCLLTASGEPSHSSFTDANVSCQHLGLYLSCFEQAFSPCLAKALFFLSRGCPLIPLLQLSTTVKLNEVTCLACRHALMACQGSLQLVVSLQYVAVHMQKLQ